MYNRTCPKRWHVEVGIGAVLACLLAGAASAKPEEPVAPLVKVAEFRLKQARMGAAAVAYRDVIYVFGGSSFAAVTTVEKFDTRTAEVTALKSELAPRRYHSVIEHEGKFHLFGGQGYGLSGDWFERVVEIYDPATGSVSHGPPMERARSQMGSVKLDGKGYFIGGTRKVGDGVAQTNNVEIFDFATGVWSKGLPMPTPREAPAVVVTGFILVPGGFRKDEGVTAVEMFVPQEKAWKKLPPLNRRTSAHTAVFHGEHLFLFGDYFDRNTVLAYDLRTRKSQIHRIPGYQGMRHAAAVVWGDYIYVIGGNFSSEAGAESDLIQIFTANPLFKSTEGN